MKAPGRFARTTLGRLRGLRLLALVAIVVVGLAAGGVGYAGRTTAGSVATGSGPAVAAAQEARASLAEANRAVVDSVRSGTARLAGPGQRYQDGITRANHAMAQLSEYYAGDVETTQQLQFVNAMLVTYMGLVGQADTAHRLTSATGADYDLGLIYLWHASKLLYDPDGGILALLDTLGQPAAEDLDRSAGAWSLGPVAPAVILIAAGLLVGLLVAIQMFLLRRFQRIVNPPLALATLMLVVLAGWASLAAVESDHDFRSALDAHDDVVTGWRDRAATAGAEAALGLTELLAAGCQDSDCQARVAGALAASLPAEQPGPTDEPPNGAGPVRPDGAGPDRYGPGQPDLAAFVSHIEKARDPAGLQAGVPALAAGIMVLVLLGFKPRLDEFRA